MPQFLSRWLEWFRAQPTETRALIIAVIVLAVIFSVLLSRVLWKIALVALAVALIGWIVQRGRGGPERAWQIAVGGSLVALLIFAVLAAAVSGPTPTEPSEQAQDDRTRQEETTTPEPAKPEEETTAVVPEVTTPEPAAGDEERQPELPPKPEPATIPGLFPVDVYGNLENQGFTCEGPDPIGDDEVWWNCERQESMSDYTVEIWGPDASSVRLVEATVLSFDPSATNELAADFLGYVATVPYEGSNPEEAKLWVEDNADATRRVSTEISGVSYTLYGTEGSRILEIKPPGTAG